MSSACLRVAIALTKQHDQNEIEEKRVYLAYTSITLFITKRNQERNSNWAGSWRQKLIWKPWKITTY
jgi:type VI protein secretion system component Hcp